MLESYEKFRESFAKLTFRSAFLSFLFGGVCLILGAGFFIDIDKPVNAGGVFQLFQFVFDLPLSNILNGIVLLLLAAFFIINGIYNKNRKEN